MTILLNEKQLNLSDRYYIKAQRIYQNEKFNFDQEESTYFILSLDSSLDASIKGSGTFAACLGAGHQNSCTGDAVIITMLGLQRSMQTVSLINSRETGDLSYIDGCSNSILVGPPRNGDPCLNYLYFPEGIDQTFHTHPSVRIGMIVYGQGLADYYEQGTIKTAPLKQGDWFVLPRHIKHRFKTSDSPMSIIVFHPDSDDGPIDERNPMKTRTYLK